MIIEFSNLNDGERQKLLSLEEDFPTEILSREIDASFDGEIAIQLIISIVPALINGLSAIVSAIITRKGTGTREDADGHYEQPPVIVVTLNNSEKKTIESAKDLEDILQCMIEKKS